MPRTARAIAPGYCYHLINRANKKARLFHERADYEQFLALIARAQSRLHLPMIAACLMPNHIHLVVRPTDGDDLAKWMHWVFTTHVRWHHEKYDGTGRVWQGRYKAFASQTDHHLLAVMRYVERNALRAKLVERAEDWEWGSLAWRRDARAPTQLSESPVPLPSYWRHFVNQPHTAAELTEIRTCVNRQRPFGEDAWVASQVKQFGLEATLRRVGRPSRASRATE